MDLGKIGLYFDGGGAGGVAYLGAIRELEERGLMESVKIVAGVSTGAIIASATAEGKTYDEIRGFMECNPNRIEKILKPTPSGLYSWIKNRTPWFPNQKNLENLMEDFVGEETLGDYPQLTILGADPETREGIPLNSRTFPSMKIKHAINLSTAIFPIFGTASIDYGGRTIKSIDGGLAHSQHMKYILDGTPIDTLLTLKVMEHPATIAMTYILSRLGYMYTNFEKTDEPDGITLIQVSSKVFPTRLLRTDKKNMEYLDKKGRESCARALDEYEKSQRQAT